MKCKCEESRTSNPRWRTKSQRPRGHGYEYLLVCLSCGWEWWSAANASATFPHISQEESEQLQYPSHNSKSDDAS